MAYEIIQILTHTLEKKLNEFVSEAPYYFGCKKSWCVDERVKLWDMLLPCLRNFDGRRTKLMMLILLALGESTPAWCANASKLGRLLGNQRH